MFFYKKSERHAGLYPNYMVIVRFVTIFFEKQTFYHTFAQYHYKKTT